MSLNENQPVPPVNPKSEPEANVLLREAFGLLSLPSLAPKKDCIALAARISVFLTELAAHKVSTQEEGKFPVVCTNCWRVQEDRIGGLCSECKAFALQPVILGIPDASKAGVEVPEQEAIKCFRCNGAGVINVLGGGGDYETWACPKCRAQEHNRDLALIYGAADGEAE